MMSASACVRAEIDFLAEGIRAGLDAISSAPPRPEESSGG
jgi:hypothetical protein